MVGTLFLATRSSTEAACLVFIAFEVWQSFFDQMGVNFKAGGCVSAVRYLGLITTFSELVRSALCIRGACGFA